MNKTFKVARSLTRGTVVTSEKASSYQGKAVKTVIAAAVASLVAGAAMAAGSTPVTINGSLEYKTTATPGYTATDVTVGTGEAEAAWKTGDALTEESVVTLKNGTLKVTADEKEATQSIKSLAGTGTVSVTAVNTTTGENATTAANANLTIAEGGIAAKESSSITLNFDSVGYEAEQALGTAKVTLSDANGAQLGFVHATNATKNSVATLAVTEHTQAEIEAAGSALTLANVRIANAGELTLTNADIALQNVDLSANAGKLTFAGAATVSGNVDGSAQSGKVIFTDGLSVSGSDTKAASYAAKSILMADKTTDDDVEDHVVIGDITLSGNLSSDQTPEVTNYGTLTVGSLNAKNANFTVNGYGRANVTSATFDGATLAVNTDGEANFSTLSLLKGSHTVSGTVAVTDTLTVGSNKSGAEQSTLTITNGEVSAQALTLNGYGSVGGKVEVAGTSTVTFGTVTVGDNSELALTASKAFKADAVTTAGGSATAAKLNIVDGTNEIGTLTVGTNDTAAITGGTNTIGTVDAKNGLTISGGDNELTLVKVADGKTVAVTGTDTTLTLGDVEGAGAGKLTFAGKALTTSWSTLDVEVGSTEATTKQKAKDIVVTDGLIQLTGEQTLTSEQFGWVKKAIDTDSSIKLHLMDTVLTDKDGKNLKFADLTSVDNYAGASTVDLGVNAGTSTQDVAADTTIGVLNLVKNAGQTDAVKQVVIGNDAAQNLTIRGNGQEFITGEKVTETLTLQNVKFGDDAAAVNGGAYSDVLNLSGSNTIAAGDWSFGDIAGDGNIAVSGGNLTIVGQAKEQSKAGANATGKYTALTIGQDTFTEAGQTTATQNPYSGNVTISGGHYLALGSYSAQAAAALAALQAEEDAQAASEDRDADKVNVIYVGEQTVVNKAPTFASASYTNNVVIDLASVGSEATYDKSQGILVAVTGSVTGADGGILVSGLSSKVVVTDEDTGATSINFGTALNGLSVDYGNIFYDRDSGYTVANGAAPIEVNAEVMYQVAELGFNTWGDVENAVYSFDGSSNPIANTIYTKMGDWVEASEEDLAAKLVASGLLKEGTKVENILDGTSPVESYLKADVDEKTLWAFIDAHEEAFENSLVNAEHAATNMAALGGAFSASLDAQNEVVGALNRRLSKANVNAVRGEVGVTPWVDVFGTTNEARRLYGSNAGYEADIYGAVLGFDYTASCGGTLGVAFNIGTGDGNSVGAGQKVENDQDFYGVSLYAAKEFGGFNTMLDLGYMTVENDLSTSSAFFGKTSEKLDADLFTVGLGAEYALDAGVAKVTPHAGIRMTRLSMDDSKYGADYDDMTVYQLPLGVAVSSTFETNGWKLAPMVDVSVVPTFGDKDAVATFTGGITDTVRVVDTNPVQGTLGVEAQNGAFTFGLNYRLTAGGDDRMNNSFNANVRYAF